MVSSGVHPHQGPGKDDPNAVIAGVHARILLMRPSLPDSPPLNALRGMTPNDVAAEVERAKRFVSASQKYLTWVELGQELFAEFDLLERSGNGEMPAELQYDRG